MIVVLTLGTFDLPHAGHFNLLRRAKALGDKLIVALNTDEFVKEYKGKKPIMSLDERAAIIENCEYVDATIVNEDEGYTTIVNILPDIIVIGSDWLNKDYLKQIDPEDQLNDAYSTLGKLLSIIYVPYTEGMSSTEIKKRLRENE